ncbi:hypothetical protein FH063_001340 [Azospirillum argentinense]|uniref:DUF2158 domain-containing protein n=2 Tax=Azospirillum argentinense TaxID=2970906 RepID=A0A5B0KX53_9PROT|nr:hypothetical protein FH063_001340 [Azospirillum argentinense]
MVAEEFKVGEVVQLKSGGPEMTVSWYGVPMGAQEPSVVCIWFNGPTKLKDSFPPGTLTKL